MSDLIKVNQYLPRLDDAMRDALGWGDCSDTGFVEAYVLSKKVEQLRAAIEMAAAVIEKADFISEPVMVAVYLRRLEELEK